MKQSELILIFIKRGRLEKIIKQINQVVSPDTLRELRAALVSDQDIAGPMQDEILAEIDDRIKVLEA